MKKKDGSKLKESQNVKPRFLTILTCPYCKEDFIIPTIYRTHLAAHINYHSKQDNFSCNICPETDLILTNMAVHVEQLHSKKRRQNSESDNIKEIENKNLSEKYRMILELSKYDDQPFPLVLPH